MTAASRRELRALGILRSPESLFTWAKKHGLLAVFLRFIPESKLGPARWEVVNFPNVEKSFECFGSTEKNLMEERAKTWAAIRYELDSWVRIEGFGGTLWPETLAEELKIYAPAVRWHRRRQHAKV